MFFDQIIILLEISLFTSGISKNTKKSHTWAVKFPIKISRVRSTSEILIGNFTAHMWDFECFWKFHELIVGFIINTTRDNWQLDLTWLIINTTCGIFSEIVEFRFEIPLFFKNSGIFFKFHYFFKNSGIWIEIPLFS